MPAIFTAQLEELGKEYQVTNIYFTEVKYIIPSAKYVDLPNEVALKLKNDLNQGKYITIKKEDIDLRTSPDISYDKFSMVSPRSLDKKKAMVKASANQKLAVYSSLLTALDIFEFFTITGKLQSYGFNVLDEPNKEAVFLNIINTGDDNLISDLERFLESKDKFDKILKRKKGLRDYFAEIDNCDTEEELNKVIEENKGNWLSTNIS